MKKFLKEDSGVITVWLTLVLVCMLSFVLLVIECVRYNMAENICTQSGKLATISAMADYEPDLYYNYHIFALDISYGEDTINKKKLKDNISRYSNMSWDPSYLKSDEGVKDILGCSVSKVSLSNIKAMDDENFVNQICSYMKEQKNLDNTFNRKELLCSYIMTHFSSYKSAYILGYMNRKYVYEVEYIIKGKKSDNKNIELVMKLLNADDIDEESTEILCEEKEYKERLYTELLKIDTELLCERMKEIIACNINRTYGKNIRFNKLITSVDVEIQYSLEKRATKIHLVNQWINKDCSKKIQYKEKFEY